MTTFYGLICQECAGRRHKYGKPIEANICQKCGCQTLVASPLDYGLDSLLRPILNREHD